MQKVTSKIGLILEDLDYQVFERLSKMMKELEGIATTAKRLNNRKALGLLDKAYKSLDQARMSLD